MSTKESFRRPEFYMPYPARCNPNVESARAHGKAWAIDLGMLGAPPGAPGHGVWDESWFDSMDFARYAALIYPDAIAPELDLLTDWHIWAWFLDDFFAETFTHSGDSAGGNEYIAHLTEYMRVPAEATPGNPAEAGLADLWARTVPAKSKNWQTRLARVVEDYLRNTAREVYPADRSWVPNPINYVIDLRRKAGGMELVACLIEHANGVEIPAAVAVTRPLRALRDTFSDGVDLRNDILSYPKESRAGEINGVTITERFLDCDLHRAVDLVNELATARMQQFEDTVRFELPILFGDYLLVPQLPLAILRYVQGLQDCMAGDHQWASQSVRYRDIAPQDDTDTARPAFGPTGVGTSATRITNPRLEHPPQVADIGTEPSGSPELLGPNRIGSTSAQLGLARRAAAVAWPDQPATTDESETELPEFYMPFAPRIHPALAEIQTRTKGWVVEMGMLDCGLSEWNEAGFDAKQIPKFAAQCFPDTATQTLGSAAEWLAWTFFLGDYSDELFRNRRDIAGAKIAFDRLIAFMPIAHPEVLPPPASPLERGLADLWRRTAPAMPEHWRSRLAESILRTCEGLLWEILNFVENQIPDPVDYLEMRRSTCGAGILVILLDYTLDLENPPEWHESVPMRELVDALRDWNGLLNDLFSYWKETEKEAEIHNFVLIMRRFLDCGCGRHSPSPTTWSRPSCDTSSTAPRPNCRTWPTNSTWMPTSARPWTPTSTDYSDSSQESSRPTWTWPRVATSWRPERTPPR
ncbi:hypothetical protein OHB26_21345 [Nocardia sp. NBC_01503]|uniref:terpene synthase family protein n=1 Tax=Nocardia sp. NBC_01503 TaxID=2975997 RepID=UPI002E7C51B1|nr:terpene synthase family protein [Nocardia sp. NBC_01503]WTL29534.1 hypothetical protein OHB26_21345 [Nocardia sp. NBC_01503]